MSHHRQHSRVPVTMDEAREYCLELERDRMRKHRRTRQGEFEAGIESIDNLIDQFDDPSKISALSDHGTAAERIANCDENPATIRRRKIDHAAQKLRRAGLGHLVPVLMLIYKNGNNRKESIWELMRKTQKLGRRRR